MKSAVDIDALAKKYGATVSIDDIAKKYGATVEDVTPQTTMPPGRAAAPAPLSDFESFFTPNPKPAPERAPITQAQGIRGPLSTQEKKDLRWQDIGELPGKALSTLPVIGGGVGGYFGGVPGAGVGTMIGQTLENLGRAAGIGPTPPPETPLGEAISVGGAGLAGAAGQYIGEGLQLPFEHPQYPLPRAPFPDAARHMESAVSRSSNIDIQDDFRDSIVKSMPNAKEAERALNTKVRDIRDAKTVFGKAADDAYAPYRTLLDATDAQPQYRVTRQQLLDEAERQLDPSIRGTRAQDYLRIRRGWERQLGQNDFGAHDLEDAAIRENAALKNKYAKDNVDRAAAFRDPNYAGDEAMLRAMRNMQDGMVQKATGYSNSAALREQYGHIATVRDALTKKGSNDSPLWYVIRTNPPLSTSEAAKRAGKGLLRSNPDQLVAKAFRSWPEAPAPTGMVHIGGWEEAPPRPFTGEEVSSQGAQPQQTPVKGKLYAQTAEARQPFRAPAPEEPPPSQIVGKTPQRIGTGQKLIPGPGETSIPEVKTPRSLLDIGRQQAPESKILRQQAAGRTFEPPTSPGYKAPQSGAEYITRYANTGMKRADILAHSEFQALPDGQRMLAMDALDPEYGKMTPQQRWKLISQVPRPPK